MICCVAAYCAVDVSLTRRDVEGAVSEASARGVRKVSSRSEVCSSALCSLVFPCASSRRLRLVSSAAANSRTGSPPDTAREARTPPPGARLPRRFRPDIVPIVRRFVRDETR